MSVTAFVYYSKSKSEMKNVKPKLLILPAFMGMLLLSWKKDILSFPYKATYSSEVVAGKHPEYAQKVLTVWKNFETGNVAVMKNYYADTVTYDAASGYRFHGRTEDLLNMARKGNEGLDSLRFDISMWQCVHLADRNEDWVYIWSTERRYPKTGKADTSFMHEQWKIEKGKITYFNQYEATSIHIPGSRE
jgi:hypothetical protein